MQQPKTAGQYCQEDTQFPLPQGIIGGGRKKGSLEKVNILRGEGHCSLKHAKAEQTMLGKQASVVCGWVPIAGKMFL